MRRYLESEETAILEMKKKGMSSTEIAEKLGRTRYGIINKMKKMEEEMRASAHAPSAKPAEEKPGDRPATKRMSPREMIRELYELGYRIKKGKLYVVTEREVNIMDIIGG